MECPKIAPAEWEVMEVLWSGGPLSAAEVIEALEARTDWHPKTIRTLLDRLSRKGAVKRTKRAGTYRFSACVAREDCVREEGRSFLNRFFGGDVLPLMAHFLEEEGVTRAELDELRKLLEKKKGEGRSR